jgi:hypothetical protein
MFPERPHQADVVILLTQAAGGKPRTGRGRHTASSTRPPGRVTARRGSLDVRTADSKDRIAEFAVFGLGATVAGFTLGAEYIGDYPATITLGIVFQYFAIAPMRGLSVRKGLIEAAKADVASLTAFEIGLFGWMALMFFVFFPAPHLHPDSPGYWLLMQIGMIAGFFTAWPVNTWLIRAGIKESM